MNETHATQRALREKRRLQPEAQLQIPGRESHLHGVLEPLSRGKEPPFCIMGMAHVNV